MGLFPSATECQQLFSSHNMLALDAVNARVYVETFRVPTACICHIVDRELLSLK